MRVPNTVRIVAEVIGMDAAVRLLAAPGKNQCVYIPQHIKPGHRLTTILREPERKAMQRMFGGELLPYPSARGVKRRIKAERKAQAIRSAIADGLTTAEIAGKHGVSERYVRRIRNKGTTSSGWRKPRKFDSQS